ncbi:MAG: alpha/beta fold hydrolase [Solirubrobacterales bacterium]|nr:alpha/beta fold hydrolase [Solirubrobacterales bacterium]
MTDQLEIPVAGGELAVFRLGASDHAEPAVLAIHGITASSRAWLAVQRALGDRASLIAPDLRGRGRSNQLPTPHGIEAHAQDMLAILDHLGLERALVVGHSLGAYIAARLADDHPDRVQALILVDGGLTIPGIEGVDPQEFIDGFLGPAVARLRMSFETREAYRNWWRSHPAFANSDVDDRDLAAYADHDLIGSAPQLRPAVSEQAVRADAAELFTMGEPTKRLTVSARMLCAPLGILNDDRPMQPLWLAREWAAAASDQRRVTLVEHVNHYTITMGAAGAAAVAEAVAEALSAG